MVSALYRGNVTEDGRLVSREPEFTIEGIPLSQVRIFEIAVVPDDWREAEPDNDNGRPSCRDR